MAVQPIPDGYHAVTPYVITSDAPGVIAFLEKAFGAQELEPRLMRPDGSIMHVAVQVGDSRIMLSEANDDSPAMPSMLYIYTEDADAAFQRAIDAGAEVVMPIEDQYYGDRNGGVKDPSGNLWWIGKQIEEADPATVLERTKEFWQSQKS